jgi:hypothetical protein
MRVGIFILVLFLSSANAAELTPLKIANTILTSDDVIANTKKWYQSEKAIFSLQQHLEVYGDVTANNCFLNHDSNVFDTVTCQIKQEDLKNGSVWEFYFFLDNGSWVGTNLGKVQDLPQSNCLTQIKPVKGIGNGIQFLQGKC